MYSHLGTSDTLLFPGCAQGMFLPVERAIAWPLRCSVSDELKYLACDTCLYPVGYLHTKAFQGSVLGSMETTEVVRLSVPQADSLDAVHEVLDGFDRVGMISLDIYGILSLGYDYILYL